MLMTHEDHGLSKRHVLAAGLHGEARRQACAPKPAGLAGDCARRFTMCQTAWADSASYEWKGGA